MPSLDKLGVTLGDKINGIFIGKGGSGKTIAAMSFPHEPKELTDQQKTINLVKNEQGLWVAEWDWRIKPVLLYYPPEHHKMIDVDMYRAEEYNKFAEKLEKQELKTPYKTIVVDSLTTLGKGIIDYSLSLRPGLIASKERKSFRMKGAIDLPEIEDYGVEAQALGNIMDALKVIPAHTILTAHYIEWSAKNVITGTDEKVTRLLTAGKAIAAAIPTTFDEIWYFTKNSDMSGKTSYICYFRGGPYPDTKTALPLPDKLDWTGKNFFEEIDRILKAKGIELSS